MHVCMYLNKCIQWAQRLFIFLTFPMHYTCTYACMYVCTWINASNGPRDCSFSSLSQCTIHVRMHVCMYLNKCIQWAQRLFIFLTFPMHYTCTYACMHVCTWINVSNGPRGCLFSSLSQCICTCMYVCTYVQFIQWAQRLFNFLTSPMYLYMYVCMHACTWMNLSSGPRGCLFSSLPQCFCTCMHACMYVCLNLPEWMHPMGPEAVYFLHFPNVGADLNRSGESDM